MVFRANGIAPAISSGSSSVAKPDVPSDRASPSVLIAIILIEQPDRASASRHTHPAAQRPRQSVTHRPPGQTVHFTSRTAARHEFRPLVPMDGVLPRNRTRQARADSLTIAPGQTTSCLGQGAPPTMILESARVENFKCIDDSTEFSIRSLTALVGKNESGKTALLKALYRINPILPVDGNFLDTEYPRRRWAAYRQRKASAPGPGRHHHVAPRGGRPRRRGRPARPRRASRATPSASRAGYDNRLRWQIDVDERRVVSNLMRRRQARRRRSCAACGP